jgi:predicted glycoside hydrolase/deacetylase ChbG (UPF0249 family)
MWNEEAYVVDVVREVATVGDSLVAAGLISTFELVAVDDGSGDTTRELLEELGGARPWIRTVVHTRNLGLGAAVRSGFSGARGDVVLYTDADLPCALGEAARALALLRGCDADIVTAWRTTRDEGPRRAVYSVVYNRLVRAMFGLDVRDVNFAFKLIRREVLDKVTLRSEGSFIDAELLIRARRQGFRCVQMPVEYHPRTRGVSTLSSAATVRRIVRELAAVRRELDRPPPVERPAVDERLLVINADDYGLTEAVSRGILEANRLGVVTSTSVLALAPAFDTTARWLADVPGIGVGAHLALVGEDPPLLPARQIPTLVDRQGHLFPTWRHFLRAAARNRIDADDVRAELEAQLARIVGAGLVLDHLDTHQHLHLWPMVGDVVIDLAQRHRIPAVRVPTSRRHTLPGFGIRRLQRGLVRHADRCGIRHVEWSAGLDEAGGLTPARLLSLLESAEASGARSAELVTHPGKADDPDRHRYAWDYRWGEELAALLAPETRLAVDRLGLRLATYADVATSTRP